MKTEISYVLLFVLFILIVYGIFGGLFTNNFKEGFETSDADMAEMLNALNNIVECDKNSSTCKREGIVDFLSFKKVLRYPNFDLDVFVSLLGKHRTKPLTVVDARTFLKSLDTKIVDVSFTKKNVEKFDANTTTNITSDPNECIDAIKQFIASNDAKSAKYDADYALWKNTTLPNWQAAKDAERNSLYAQWDQGLYPRAGEIVWENKIQVCGGGYGGCCNEAPEWQRKCECKGYSSGCGHCFGTIKYMDSTDNYCKTRYPTPCPPQGNNRSLCIGPEPDKVTPENNRFGPWEQFYASKMSEQYKTQPPEPPKPVFPTLQSICQDCRQYNLGNTVTDSKNVVFEQANTCIAYIQKDAADKAAADKLAKDAADKKAADDKAAADKAAADKVVSDKVAADKASADTRRKMYIGGGVGGGLFLCSCIIVIVIIVMTSQGGDQN